MHQKIQNGTTSPASRNEDPFPFDEFVPTLAQCFFIVLAGYLASRLRLLSASDMRGVQTFANYFAMPGIVCVSLADADLSDLRWQLLAGLVLGKSVLFAGVSAAARILGSDARVAALAALFCVHSNDLPVGNPLISALYRDVRPDMTKYLFFMPALTLLCWVPLGNALLDRRSAPLSRRTAQAFLGLLRSPVILSTAVGLVLNLTFRARIPGVLHQPINVIAATIPGLALSILGFNMVNKERHLVSSALVYAAVFLVVKMIVTPLLLHACVRWLSGGGSSSKHLSDFALLYGVISPATVVFQTGQRFRKPYAAMSAALILSSLTCFPLSYAVARVTVTRVHELVAYEPTLRRLLLPLSGAAIVAIVASLFSMALQKEATKAPGCYVVWMSLTQLATSCSLLSRCLDEPLSPYLLLALSFGGEAGALLWAAGMAVLLLRPGIGCALSASAFGLSAMMTCVLCLLISFNEEPSVCLLGRPNTDFETLQLTVMTVVMGLSQCVVGACLVIHCRKKGTSPNESSQRCGQDSEGIYCIAPPTPFFAKSANSASGEIDETGLYYRDVLQSGAGDGRLVFGRKWTFRYFSLLLLLWIVAFTRFITNLFKLAQSKSLEILLPLEFLQATFFAGQGFVIFLTFGIDIRTKVISIVKWIRQRRFGQERPNGASSDPCRTGDDAAFCDRFLALHLDRCAADIAEERSWKGEFFKDCFWGHQLVDWLVERGLCSDDAEAEELGRKLTSGGLLRHVRGARTFRDATRLYHFVRKARD